MDDIGNIDLSNITLVQFSVLLVAITAIDVIGSMLKAIAAGKFSSQFVAVWVQSHVLQRQFPIFGLAILGHGFGDLLVPIPPLWGIALAGLLAYVIETVASLRQAAGQPVDEDPVPA